MEKRFSIIDSLLQGGDKNIMRDFIGSLEKAAQRSNLKIKKDKILDAKIFAKARGSSPKILLEWLSCVV